MQRMRQGRQTPTFERIGDYAYSRGKEAVLMFESYGRRYYDSQKHEMELLFARNENSEFAAKDIGITKPRQNGKSFAARDYAIWMSFVEGLTVLYSAHNGGVARKMFREIKSFVESREDFRNQIDSICESRGYEGIYLKNGAYIEFQTRSSGVRGGTYRILIIDEAQELTAEQSNALIPTASAAAELTEANAEPQKIYIGTVPDANCRGTVFKQMHDRVHDGLSSAWWAEWGVISNSLSEIDLDDISLWYECNPAMGRRMSENTVRSERDTMTPDGFARERLGWWSPHSAAAAIDPDKWMSCRTANPAKDGLLCYAVKFSPDGATGSISVCRKPTEGKPHIELVCSRPMSDGLSYFADFIEERKDRAAMFVIDGKSNAQTLADELRRRRIPKRLIALPKSTDVSNACAGLLNAIHENAITHIGQEELDDSATKSKRRNIGNDGGWGFADNGSESTYIESCALALWGALNPKRDPNRKAKVAF